ncbi:unnamed protein product, partial [Allacma fusca]
VRGEPKYIITSSTIEMETEKKPPSMEIEVLCNLSGVEVEVEENPPALEVEVENNPQVVEYEIQENPPALEVEVGENPRTEPLDDSHILSLTDDTMDLIEQNLRVDLMVDEKPVIENVANIPTEQPESDIGTTTPKTDQCLICLNPVMNSILTRDQNPTSSMLLLSKIFKVTQTVYHNIDLNALHAPLYCASCSKSLNEALNILRDIKTLENKLNLLADDLKVQLVSSYRRPRRSITQEIPNHDRVFGQLRETFAQCWSECVVGVPRVSVKIPEKPVREVHPPVKIESTERNKRRIKIKVESAEQIKKRMQAEKIGKRKTRIKVENTENIKTEAPIESMINEDNDNDMGFADDPADLDYFPDQVETHDGENEDLHQESQDTVQENEEVKIVNKVGNKKRKRNRKEKPKHLNLGIMRFSKDQQEGKQYPFTCQICGKGYLQKHFLDAHEQSHDGKLKFSCIICFKEFSLERHLRLHEVNGHRLPSTNARKVQKRRFNSSNESMNVYTKNGILLGFTCEYCQQKFEKSAYVTEDGKFKLVCNHHPGCEKEFFVFSVFRTHHEKTCPSRPTELVHCDDCGKDFSSSKVLQDHRTSFHTKQYEFYCELCGLGLCNRGTLNRHMICHTEEKQHQCPICEHRFKRKMQLTYHMRKHNTESLLMCGTCGKTFANPQDLKNHELIHTNEKQFPCPICNKFFTTKNYVYTHIWATHKKARLPRQVRSSRDKSSKNVPDPATTVSDIPEIPEFPNQ